MLDTETWEELCDRGTLRVPPDLTPEIASRRWRQINLMLRVPLLFQSQPAGADPARVILELARSIVSADRGLLYVCDVTPGRAHAAAAFGFTPRLPERLQSANALAAAAMQSRKPLLIRRTGSMALARELRLLGSASCLSVPVVPGGSPWGVLQLLREERFGEDDGILLWTYALLLEGLLPGLAGRVPRSAPDRPFASRTEVESEVEIARWTARPCALVRVVWRPAPGSDPGSPALHTSRVLRMVRATLRPVDRVAPWAEGDLLIALPHTDAAGAQRAIQVLRQRLVRSRCLDSQEARAREALTFKYAASPAHGDRLENLLQAVGLPDRS